MKVLFLFYLLGSIIILTSCQKEYSIEQSSSDAIIGANCRISKIAYSDSTSGVGLGSLSASISSLDKVNTITDFDSIALSINAQSTPLYLSDTIYIDANQYYIQDTTTTRIKTFHGYINPISTTNFLSFDVVYNYNTSGYLVSKIYTYNVLPNPLTETVTYTYTSGNLTNMVITDQNSGFIISDALVGYNTSITPKNYIYIFPDEQNYSSFTQFFNFGLKPTNAVQDLKVRYYYNNIVSDSTISTFSQYALSQDNYVKSVYMSGNDQSSIPAQKGKLNFSYHCK